MSKYIPSIPDLIYRLRANVGRFKPEVESFMTQVEEVMGEEAETRELLRKFLALVDGQIARTEKYASEVDQAIIDGDVGQAMSLGDVDQLIEKFDILVEKFGDDLMTLTQDPAQTLDELERRERLLESFQGLIFSKIYMLDARLELLRHSVEVEIAVRFARLQKVEELIKSIGEIIKSIEDLIESFIDLRFKRPAKIEELLKSVEELLKSFEDLIKSLISLEQPVPGS